MQNLISDWTVDYGTGSNNITVPHAWRQDVSVRWEGPATYQTRIRVPSEKAWLVFQGVSYQAIVSINGEQKTDHRGIWDAFSIDLSPYKNQEVEVEVKVVKNGGTTFPVRDVASGFIPYVYNTFGGIYREVELVTSNTDPLADQPVAPPTRVKVDGRRVYVDGKPFYARGVLTWGWYPELGHLNPDEATIRKEIRQTKELGFNLIKFCLWVPSHRFLKIMKEEGVEAWLELPLWDPSSDPDHLDEIAKDLERIVVQYRRHDNIVMWTVGCELSTATPAVYRKRLVEMVEKQTGCPLVKDNSGGAEMYGGDLREFGDFYDFHPYCDTNIYPTVLESLMPGPRTDLPVFFGEFNDIDVHRDVARIAKTKPYWAADDDDLNHVGVRWQFDIPKFIKSIPYVQPENERRHRDLMDATKSKAIFTRKFVHENVRSRDSIAGYVITGWRDTPISTAGVIDDWGELRYTPEEVASWNGEDVLFPIPTRRPPWITGGNRPGWLDPYCHEIGPVLWKVGIHSQKGVQGDLNWTVTDSSGKVVASGDNKAVMVEPLRATQLEELYWEFTEPGKYLLTVELGNAKNQWTLWALNKPDWQAHGGWSVHDPAGLLEGLSLPEGPNVIATRPCAKVNEAIQNGDSVLLFLVDELSTPACFWRESGYEYADEALWRKLGIKNEWERLIGISGDRAIDLEALKAILPKDSEIEVLMKRVDVRTYVEATVMVRSGNLIATTLRPFGGLGVQPLGLPRNPSGKALLVSLMDTALNKKENELHDK
jgi:hypothetical protein